MQKTKQFVIRNLKFIIIFVLLVIPVVSFAALPGSPGGGLVPCDNSAAKPCDFNAFMNMINIVINYIFKYLAVPIAAIMFAYAGVLMVASGGSTESRGKAKKIFTNAALGLIIAAISWVVIKTILSILSPEGAWTWI